MVLLSSLDLALKILLELLLLQLPLLKVSLLLLLVIHVLPLLILRLLSLLIVSDLLHGVSFLVGEIVIRNEEYLTVLDTLVLILDGLRVFAYALSYLLFSALVL